MKDGCVNDMSRDLQHMSNFASIAYRRKDDEEVVNYSINEK